MCFDLWAFNLGEVIWKKSGKMHRKACLLVLYGKSLLVKGNDVFWRKPTLNFLGITGGKRCLRGVKIWNAGNLSFHPKTKRRFICKDILKIDAFGWCGVSRMPRTMRWPVRRIEQQCLGDGRREVRRSRLKGLPWEKPEAAEWTRGPASFGVHVCHVAVSKDARGP